MNRTGAGLVDVARHLTGPMAGVHRAVTDSPGRIATRAFERLGGDCHDLEMLERALDRLPGLPEPADSVGSRRPRRSRTPHRSATRQDGAPDSQGVNGGNRRSDGGAAGDSGNGEAPPRNTRRPAPPAWPQRDYPVATGPRLGSYPGHPEELPPQPPAVGRQPLDRPLPLQDQTAVSDVAPQRAPDGYQFHGQPPPSNGAPTEDPNRVAAPVGPAGADPVVVHGAARTEDARSPYDPADHPGALGDLLRRSQTRAPSPGALETTNGGLARPARPAPQDATRATGALRVDIGVPTATFVVEAFEMAMDEMVRREAERHGLEGEL